MTDSRGDVSIRGRGKHSDSTGANDFQVAYLMADISDVSGSVIKDLYQSLESLSCKSSAILTNPWDTELSSIARIVTRVLY